MASKARILRLRPHQFGSIRAPNHRFYHSYDHPSPHPETFTPIEKTILQAAARHIPSHGFTQTTLGLGAKDAGYLDASTNIFPNGAFSLVHYHLLTQRLSLAQRSGILEPLPNGEPLGVGGKVKALAWARLIGNKEVIHRWQEALALMAQPSNLPTSIKELSLLSDEIWFLAGDTSVDTSWYTKRASLSTIYAATELFMTTDKSTDFTNTREFMDRRFKDSQILGRAVGSVGQWVGFTAHAGLNVLRSKGVRI